MLRPGSGRRLRQDGGAVGHQRLVRLAGTIPLDEREFRMMQRAALAVAERLGEFDDAALAGREQLLAGELRRGAQIKPCRGAVGRFEHGGEGVQVSLVARRDLQGPGLDLDEIMRGKPGAQGGHDAGARHQHRPPVGVNVRGPEGRSGGREFRHVLVRVRLRKYVAIGLRIAMLRPDLSQKP